jgi:hypothetical protein
VIRICRFPFPRRTPASAATTGGVPWGEHDPERPGWHCRACRAPWPCPAAQQRLQTAYQSRRRDLGTLLAILRDQAVIDLPDAAPGELGHRFLDWYRRGPQPAPARQTIVQPDARDGKPPLASDRRLPHHTGRLAHLDALFVAFFAEADQRGTDVERVPDSVIFAVAVQVWLATTDPDRRETAYCPGTATRVLHGVDPRTGRHP